MVYRAYLLAAPLASIVALGVILALRAYRAEDAARELRRFLALSLWLALSNACELLAPTEALTLVFAKLEYIAFVLLPLSFVRFCFYYSGYERYIKKGLRASGYVVAAVLFALVATNELHGLMWTSVDFPVREGFLTMKPSYGPVFWLTAVFAWGIISLGAAVVLWTFVFEKGPYRTRSFAIAAATLLPGFFNVLYVTRLLPGFGKDFTPIGFLLAGIVFYAGVYRKRSFRVVPLARGVVFEELDEGVVFVDADGRLADYNASARRLLSLSNGDLGKPCALLASFAPLADLVAVALASGRATGEASLDGKSIVMRATRIDGSSGSRGVAMTLSDVTERARLESELEAARVDMLKREHFAVIGRLSADIAHEVNNPLGYIWAEIRSIKATAAGSISEPRVRSDVFDMIESVEEGLSRIEKVVRSLLEYAKRGSSEEVSAPYDLAAGIQGALDLSRSDYARVADVDVDVRGDLSVRARGSEIDRVLLNILRNAAEGVRARVGDTGQRGKIWVRAWSDGKTVVCDIGNDGAIIPEENTRTIFKEFFSTKAGGKGTGLGLSISKSIVEKRHGGRLALVSRDPVVFRMELPVDEGSAPSP